jgi:hypothetical protein
MNKETKEYLQELTPSAKERRGLKGGPWSPLNTYE